MSVELAPNSSAFPANARPQPAGPSDAALVLAARAGEPWAFEALYRRYTDLVHGLAYRLLGGGSDVDDVVQESFIAAFKSLDRLAEANAFRSWLCGIVVRTTCKLLRRYKLLRRLGLRRGDAAVDFESFIGRQCPPDVYAELTGIYGLLKAMPAEARVALVLRRVEGATLEEVAQWTGLSLATVKRRLAAAEKQLELALADDAGESMGDASSGVASSVTRSNGGEP